MFVGIASLYQLTQAVAREIEERFVASTVLGDPRHPNRPATARPGCTASPSALSFLLHRRRARRESDHGSSSCVRSGSFVESIRSDSTRPVSYPPRNEDSLCRGVQGSTRLRCGCGSAFGTLPDRLRPRRGRGSRARRPFSGRAAPGQALARRCWWVRRRPACFRLRPGRRRVRPGRRSLW